MLSMNHCLSHDKENKVQIRRGCFISFLKLKAGLRIRIRLDPVFLPGSNLSGSGSGFSPDTGTKKRVSAESDLPEENLKIMTKDSQKMKKATISY